MADDDAARGVTPDQIGLALEVLTALVLHEGDAREADKVAQMQVDEDVVNLIDLAAGLSALAWRLTVQLSRATDIPELDLVQAMAQTYLQED